MKSAIHGLVIILAFLFGCICGAVLMKISDLRGDLTVRMAETGLAIKTLEHLLAGEVATVEKRLRSEIESSIDMLNSSFELALPWQKSGILGLRETYERLEAKSTGLPDAQTSLKAPEASHGN